MPTAFYAPDGDGFAATELTRGPWSPHHQHAGPPTALLGRAIRLASALPDGQTARLTADILRPVPIARLTIATEMLRPGRRVEQLAATLMHDGEALVRATAWRVRREPTTAGLAPEAPPPRPQEAEPVELPWWDDEVAYHRAFEWRLASGSVAESGPACVWTRMNAALVEGEEAEPLERLLAMADAASGVSWTLPWDEYLFPNLDFSVHLERPPEGTWMAMDAVTRPGPLGAGQCTAVLHDERGRVGSSTQTLLVQAR